MNRQRTPINNSNSVINRKETKTRRGNIFMRPSTWAAIQKILWVTHDNFNNLVSTLLEKHVEENMHYIHQFDEEHKELT